MSHPQDVADAIVRELLEEEARERAPVVLFSHSRADELLEKLREMFPTPEEEYEAWLDERPHWSEEFE